MELTSKLLTELTRAWIIEARARPDDFPDWLRTTLCETWEGDRYISEVAYDWLSEADRSNLQKKEIQVTRNGKTFTTTVYVRKGDEPAGAPGRPAPPRSRRPLPRRSTPVM